MSTDVDLPMSTGRPTGFIGSSNNGVVSKHCAFGFVNQIHISSSPELWSIWQEFLQRLVCWSSPGTPTSVLFTIMERFARLWK
jgi:hypothetical protein